MSNDPLSWINDELQRLEQQDLRRRVAVRQGPQNPAQIVLNGRTVANFGSNDYLGFAANALTSQVNELAASSSGWGAGASPLLAGHSQLHATLQQELARFKQAEDALLFSSGYAANVGTIPALAEAEDIVFSDSKNHASIIDGCRLSKAHVHVYPHRDIDALRIALASARRYRRRLIVTDSLFSMDGDMAPLEQLATLAEEHQCILMVDEAHATGVFGAHGRGLCEQWHVEDGVHVQMGTLSKALGSVGGFVVGSTALIEWLFNRARTYFFSTAPADTVAAAGLAALQLVRDEPQRRRELLRKADQFRDRLCERGVDIGQSQSQIIPAVVHSAAKALRCQNELFDCGYYVPGIRPPTVPANEALLRISLSYAHSTEQIEQLLTLLTQVVGR